MVSSARVGSGGPPPYGCAPELPEAAVRFHDEPVEADAVHEQPAPRHPAVVENALRGLDGTATPDRVVDDAHGRRRRALPTLADRRPR